MPDFLAAMHCTYHLWLVALREDLNIFFPNSINSIAARERQECGQRP
jgi:hypothetical protein